MLDEQPDTNDLISCTSPTGLLSDKMRAFMNGGLAEKRDRSDPSYQRPIRGDPERIRTYRQITQSQTLRRSRKR